MPEDDTEVLDVPPGDVSDLVRLLAEMNAEAMANEWLERGLPAAELANLVLGAIAVSNSVMTQMEDLPEPVRYSLTALFHLRFLGELSEHLVAAIPGREMVEAIGFKRYLWMRGDQP